MIKVQVGFAIGTIEADDQVVSGVCIEHVFIVYVYGLKFPRRLDPATAI